MNVNSADESVPLNEMALGSAHGEGQRELVLLSILSSLSLGDLLTMCSQPQHYRHLGLILCCGATL